MVRSLRLELVPAVCPCICHIVYYVLVSATSGLQASRLLTMKRRSFLLKLCAAQPIIIHQSSVLSWLQIKQAYVALRTHIKAAVQVGICDVCEFTNGLSLRCYY